MAREWKKRGILKGGIVKKIKEDRYGYIEIL
jgi:hypothetical protein